MTGVDAEAERASLLSGQRHAPSSPDAGTVGSPLDASPGPLESSVRRDVEGLGPLTSGVRATMAEMAFGLARRLDAAYANDEPLATIAKANQELRSTLLQVTRTADDNARRDRLTEFLGEAVDVPADVGNAP